MFHVTDELHSVPIGQMGNYQEHLKKVNQETPPLRPLENTPTRVHMFGNPFKVNKVSGQLNVVLRTYLAKFCRLFFRP